MNKPVCELSHCQESGNHLTLENGSGAKGLVKNKCSSSFEKKEFCKLHTGKSDFIPGKASKIEY